MATGGKPQGVYVVSDADIAAGKFRVAPGKAIKVVGMQAATRGIEGGSLTPVYVVSDPSVRGVEGGEPIPVSNLTSGNRMPYKGLAIPVYVVADDGQFETPSWWSEWWQGHGIDAEDFIAVYQGKGAPSFDDSLTNLANPGTHDLVPDIVNASAISNGGQLPRAATFDPALGWTWNLNGTPIWDNYGFFHTGLLPVFGWGAMIRCDRQESAITICSPFGSRGTGAERFMVQHNGTTGTFYSPNGGIQVTGVSNLGDSTFGFFGQKAYKNGVHVATAPVGTVSPAEIILWGRMEVSGLNSAGGTGSAKAFVLTGAITPSDAEVLALHNAMMAL